MKKNNIVYSILPVEYIDIVDYNEILEDSKYSVRRSIDNSLFLIKWKKDSEPSFINYLNTDIIIFDYDQINNILSTEKWSDNKV